MAENRRNRAANLADARRGAPLQADAAVVAATSARGEARRAPGPTIIKNAMDVGIDHFFEHLQQCAAAKPDGMLGLDELQDAVATFKATPDDRVAAFCREAWNRCLQTALASRWEIGQTRPLERLIVDNFSHLLPPPGQSPIPGKHLSRRILGPFINALRLLLGPDQFAQYESGCERLIQRLEAEHGADFTWNIVAADPSARTMVNDVIVHISRHLTQVQKRRRWMVDIMAAGMAPPDSAGERQWQFGDREYHMLIDTLYFGIRGALDNEQDKQAMISRYGENNVEKLHTMFRMLDRDYIEMTRMAGQN